MPQPSVSFNQQALVLICKHYNSIVCYSQNTLQYKKWKNVWKGCLVKKILHRVSLNLYIHVPTIYLAVISDFASVMLIMHVTFSVIHFFK